MMVGEGRMGLDYEEEEEFRERGGGGGGGGGGELGGQSTQLLTTTTNMTAVSSYKDIKQQEEDDEESLAAHHQSRDRIHKHALKTHIANITQHISDYMKSIADSTPAMLTRYIDGNNNTNTSKLLDTHSHYTSRSSKRSNASPTGNTATATNNIPMQKSLSAPVFRTAQTALTYIDPTTVHQTTFLTPAHRQVDEPFNPYHPATYNDFHPDPQVPMPPELMELQVRAVMNSTSHSPSHSRSGSPNQHPGNTSTSIHTTHTMNNTNAIPSSHKHASAPTHNRQLYPITEDSCVTTSTYGYNPNNTNNMQSQYKIIYCKHTSISYMHSHRLILYVET